MSENKTGSIEEYKKAVMVNNGKIDKMYWAHSTGDQVFDHIDVVNIWKRIYPKDDHLSPKFLWDRGFKLVYVDGQKVERPTSTQQRSS